MGKSIQTRYSGKLLLLINNNKFIENLLQAKFINFKTNKYCKTVYNKKY